MIYQYEPDRPKVHITMSPASTLNDVLEQMDAFLKASGYVYDGIVDIVPLDQGDFSQIDTQETEGGLE